MAQLSAGFNYTSTGTNSLVTAGNLNQHVNNAQLQGGAIGEQNNVTTLTGNEYTLIYNSSTGLLGKTQIKNALLTGNDVITDSILGGTLNGQLTISPSNSLLSGGSLLLYGGSYGGEVGEIRGYANEIAFSAGGPANAGSFEATSGTGGMRFASNGQIIFETPVVFQDSIEFQGGINNSTPYFLYEVYEETVTGWAATYAGEYPNIWTSAQFTKPSSEIWKFEIEFEEDGYKGYGYSMSMFYVSSGAGTAVYVKNFVDSQAGGWHTSNSEYHSWTVKQGTALTNEQLRFRANAGNGSQMRLFQTYAGGITFPESKFRIYKYKSF